MCNPHVWNKALCCTTDLPFKSVHSPFAVIFDPYKSTTCCSSRILNHICHYLPLYFLFMNLSKHVDDVLFDMWLSNFSFSHSWSTKLKHNGNSSYNYVISSMYIMQSFWMSWHVEHDELYFVWKKDIYLSLYTCCCCGGSSQLIYDSKPASANVNHSMTARNRMADLEKFFAGTLHSLTTFTSKCHLLLISCCHLLLLRTRLNSPTLSMLACLVMWYSI